MWVLIDRSNVLEYVADPPRPFLRRQDAAVATQEGPADLVVVLLISVGGLTGLLTKSASSAAFQG